MATATVHSTTRGTVGLKAPAIHSGADRVAQNSTRTLTIWACRSPPSSTSQRWRPTSTATYVEPKTAPRRWLTKVCGIVVDMTRVASMARMIISRMAGRCGLYRLVVQASRYQIHHMASSSTRARYSPDQVRSPYRRWESSVNANTNTTSKISSMKSTRCDCSGSRSTRAGSFAAAMHPLDNHWIAALVILFATDRGIGRNRGHLVEGILSKELSRKICFDGVRDSGDEGPESAGRPCPPGALAADGGAGAERSGDRHAVG